MLALTVVVIWFAVVAYFLIRQWWLSELAQAGEGVPAPAPVTLPVQAVPVSDTATATGPAGAGAWQAAA
jgi:hypothetical protein